MQNNDWLSGKLNSPRVIFLSLVATTAAKSSILGIFTGLSVLVWIFPWRTNSWRFRRDLPDLRIWCMWRLHIPAVTRRRSSVAGMTRSHWGQVTWCNGRLHQIVAAMLVSGTGILLKSSHLNHTCYGKGLVRSVLRWKWMGSYTKLTIDRMPLLVVRLSFKTMLKPN